MPKVFTSGVGTFPENLETSIILYFKNHATSYLKGFEHYSMGQYLSRVVPLNLISSYFWQLFKIIFLIVEDRALLSL